MSSLIPRSYWFHSGTGTTHTNCPNKTMADPVQVPIVGHIFFNQLGAIVSLACLVLASLISFYLIFRHATHFSIPKEQKQIIRIIFMIPVFALIAFLAIIFPGISIYLIPIEGLYESFALCSFFLLMSAYIDEDDEEREAFFVNNGTSGQHRRTTIGVFQFPVVMLGVTIATEVTEALGIYCRTSDEPKFAHIYLTSITLATTLIAIVSVIHYYHIMRSKIMHRHPLSKLLAFKTLITLTVVQTGVFAYLTSSIILHPTTRITFVDITITIPNLLTSLETVFFALIFLRVYRAREYLTRNRVLDGGVGHGSNYYGGFAGWRAIGEAMNPLDIIRGIFAVPRNLLGLSVRKNNGSGMGRSFGKMVKGSEYESVELAPNPEEFKGLTGLTPIPEEYRSRGPSPQHEDAELKPLVLVSDRDRSRSRTRASSPYREERSGLTSQGHSRNSSVQAEEYRTMVLNDGEYRAGEYR